MLRRLSPRESRRLVRQLLRQQELAPGPAMLFASGARPRRDPRPPSPATRALGPYELGYAISDGYTAERTIIVP